MFGSVENIGKDVGLIHSEYDDEKSVCPQEVPFEQWKWYSLDSMGTWSRPSGNQFQIQCGKKLFKIQSIYIYVNENTFRHVGLV